MRKKQQLRMIAQAKAMIRIVQAKPTIGITFLIKMGCTVDPTAAALARLLRRKVSR
jgi:hypothetical protein